MLIKTLYNTLIITFLFWIPKKGKKIYDIKPGECYFHNSKYLNEMTGWNVINGGTIIKAIMEPFKICRSKYLYTNGYIRSLIKPLGSKWIMMSHGKAFKPAYKMRVSGLTYWLFARNYYAFVSSGPLMDELLVKDHKKDVRIIKSGFPNSIYLESKLKSQSPSGMIAYLPTWRPYTYDFDVEIEILIKKYGRNKILFKPHPLSKMSEVFKNKYGDMITNKSAESIYLEANALITDYSSVMFDFSTTNRPIYILALDIKEYEKYITNLIDISKMPNAVLSYGEVDGILGNEQKSNLFYKHFAERMNEYEKNNNIERLIKYED